MSELSECFLLGNKRFVPESPTPQIQYYRVPHDIERFDWPDDLRYRTDGSHGHGRFIQEGAFYPEVYRLQPDHRTELDCYWQKLWKNLNPMLSDKVHSSLLGTNRAWTNNTGFPDRYNCLTGEDEEARLPEFDAPRVCGGAYLTGEEIGDRFYLKSLFSNNHSYTPEEVLKTNWLWYWGTGVNPEGKVSIISRRGIDGRYYPVRIPIITEQRVWLSASHLHKWPLGEPLKPANWLP